ncbi:MAG: MoaD family protein [Spirochaetota bacterium]|nr:MoaD family protein [Spirochaetota bacterium]
MGVKVSIPAPLRQYCNKQKLIELDGSNIKDVLKSMLDNYSMLYSKICEENGDLRHYVNLYVNGVDIKKMENLETNVKDNDSVTIIPAVAGGYL